VIIALQKDSFIAVLLYSLNCEKKTHKAKTQQLIPEGPSHAADRQLRCPRTLVDFQTLKELNDPQEQWERTGRRHSELQKTPEGLSEKKKKQ
jgi:hypothetical protein